MRSSFVLAALVAGCASRGLDLEVPNGVVVGGLDFAVAGAADFASADAPDLGPPPPPPPPPVPASCNATGDVTAVATPSFDRATLTAGSYVESIAVGDLDGDGFLDLVTANRNDFVADYESVSVILSSGGGSFQPQVKYVEPLYSSSVVVGDFNHDGRLDVASDTGDSFQVRLNRGGGVLGPSTSYPDNTRNAWAFVTVDVDHDGNLDIVADSTAPPDDPSANAIYVWRGRGDGTFGDVWTLHGAGGEYMAGGDFNEDGYADIAYASQEARTIGIALGQPDGTLLAHGVWALPDSGYPQGLAVGDVDGDGHLDIVVASYSYTGASTVVVAPGDGRGAIGCVTSLSSTHWPGAIAIADFNRDGRVDLIVTDYAYAALDFHGGLGHGAFAAPVHLSTAPFGGPDALTVGDFDHDGFPDVAVGSSNNADVNLLFNR
jgi:VCBS repeat protein